MAGEPQKEVAFEEVAFDARAVADLSRIAGMGEVDFAFYARSVAAGGHVCTGVFVNGARVGTVIWSLSDGPHGTALVVDELGAEATPGVDVVKAVEALTEALATHYGANAIRFITRRKGFLRALDNYELTYILERKNGL